MQAEAPAVVLVVDDNRVNRMTLTRAVRELGYDVSEAEDGTSALARVRQGPPDAVLLDVVMPGIGGIEVLEQMKADPLLRDIPVVVVSALDETEDAVRCIEMGAEDYLAKPVDPILLRARLEAGLRRRRVGDLEARLRDQERLASLGRIAANVAHEINNPVAAAIRALEEAAQAAKDGAPEGPEVSAPPVDALERADREAEVEAFLERRGVERPWDLAAALVGAGHDEQSLARVADGLSPDDLAAALTRLAASCALTSALGEARAALERVPPIVAKLKAYSYMDRAPEQEIDVAADLGVTVDLLAPQATGVEIAQAHRPDARPVLGVGGELMQVWTNLLDNAIDAAGPSGKVTVSTRQDGDWLLVEVEDDGGGIREEDLPRIFDPFFTTKERGEGSGLGLAIAAEIVRRHGGTIEVESAPGATRFTVRLPSAPRVPGGVRGSREAGPSVPPSSRPVERGSG